jgi:hypothetical protein
MSRLKTNGKKKKNKGLRRVEKVVILGIRRGIDQAKKWKAKIVNRSNNQKRVALKAETAKVVKAAKVG